MATRKLSKEKKAKPPLTVTHPDVAAQWHPTLNNGLKPENFTHGSQKKIWWLCGENSDHIWDAVIYSRTTGGAGCRFCSGNEPTLAKSLSTLRPDLAAELHPSENPGLSPDKLSLGSNRFARWVWAQDSSHVYTLRVYLRVQGYGCRICKSLLVLNPTLAEQWHPTLNGSLKPRDVNAWSNKPAYWQCPVNPEHVWHAPINNRMAGRGCPSCTNRGHSTGTRPKSTNLKTPKTISPRNTIIHPSISLATLNPELSQEWHPTKNPDTPNDVVPGSSKKRWWICRNHEIHIWDAVVRERARFETGCPYCAHQELSITNCLQTLYPEIAKEWHPEKTRVSPLIKSFGAPTGEFGGFVQPILNTKIG